MASEINDTIGGRPPSRRRKTPMDYVTMISGICGMIAAVTVVTGSVTDALPFVQKAPYAKDWADNDVRMQQAESLLRAQRENVAAIIQNSQLSLQIQLQSRVEALTETINRTPEGSTKDSLRATRDDLNQKLHMLSRRLEQ